MLFHLTSRAARRVRRLRDCFLLEVGADSADCDQFRVFFTCATAVLIGFGIGLSSRAMLRDKSMPKTDRAVSTSANLDKKPKVTKPPSQNQNLRSKWREIARNPTRQGESGISDSEELQIALEEILNQAGLEGLSRQGPDTREKIEA